jgi:hypothetical protein
MRLHRLRPDGLDVMANWLDGLRQGALDNVPQTLLEASEVTEIVDSDREVGQRRFKTRWEFASYVDEILDGELETLVGRDKGFWAWLTLVYFADVCPKDRLGYRKPGKDYRYIPDTSDYRTYYRHLLAGPWRVYRAHRDNPGRALAVLAGPLDQPGEVAEQIASRHELVSNPTVMEAVTKLYFDRSSGALRRGAGAQRNGGARRLADVLSQFDLTFDLQSVGPDRLLDLLPAEFDRFKKAS